MIIQRVSEADVSRHHGEGNHTVQTEREKKGEREKSKADVQKRTCAPGPRTWARLTIPMNQGTAEACTMMQGTANDRWYSDNTKPPTKKTRNRTLSQEPRWERHSVRAGHVGDAGRRKPHAGGLYAWSAATRAEAGQRLGRLGTLPRDPCGPEP